MPKSFMTPRRGQLAALSVASLLSLAKLAADGYMVSALGVLLKKYRDIEDCMGDDCPVPTWFTPQSNDDIQKEWKRLANLRGSSLSYWRTLQHANIAYCALMLVYLLSCVIVRVYSRDADAAWLWVRSDLIVFSALGVFGIACGASLLSLSWTFGVSYTSAGWAMREDESMFSARSCHDLGQDCTLGMIIVWPIGAIFLALAVFEFVYVFRCHGGQKGWCHSLSFLQAVPSQERGVKSTYTRGKAEDGDVFVPDGELLIPFTKYAGQSDSPPVYFSPIERSAAPPWAVPKTSLAGAMSIGPNSVAPSSLGPSSTYTSSYAHTADEELPPFEGPVRGPGIRGYEVHKTALVQKGSYAGHKAALVAQGSYAEHKAALVDEGSYAGHKAALVGQGSYAGHKAALVDGGSYAGHKAALVGQSSYAGHKAALVDGGSYAGHKAPLVGQSSYAGHKAALLETDLPAPPKAALIEKSSFVPHQAAVIRQ